MIRFAVRSVIAMITFVGLTTTRHAVTGHPLPTTLGWIVSMILVIVVTQIIHVIDDRMDDQ